MNENEYAGATGDLQACRSVLQAQLLQLRSFLQQDLLPPAELCESTADLMQLILQAQENTLYKLSKLQIRVEDVSGEGMTVAAYFEELQGHDGVLRILWELALRKLVPAGDALLSGQTAQHLIECGYISAAQIWSAAGQETWYMLTKKCWQLFRRKRVMNALKKETDPLYGSLPSILLDSPTVNTAQSVAGYWMLQQYFLSDRSETESVLFSIPDHVRIFAACRARETDREEYVIAWIPEIFTEEDLEYLRALISDTGIERIVLVAVEADAVKQFRDLFGRRCHCQIRWKFLTREVPDEAE